MAFNKYSISQNFTESNKLLEQMNAFIHAETSVVLDIGAGKGAITQLLVPKFTDVVAIEPDPRLSRGLDDRFHEHIILKTKEFSAEDLPAKPFSVIANIPFRYTAEILNTLLQSEQFTYGLIIVQKEAAEKFAGKQIKAKRTLISSQYEVDFDLDVVIRCKPTDFQPIPRVSIVILEIKRKKLALVSTAEKEKYNDFLAYTFNKSVPVVARAYPKLTNQVLAQKVVSNLTTDELLELFQLTKQFAGTYKGYAMKITAQKNSIQKIFRTRKSADWLKLAR
jgi:23S rRNA (adenine-N6)-dimethyltransferase